MCRINPSLGESRRKRWELRGAGLRLPTFFYALGASVSASERQNERVKAIVERVIEREGYELLQVEHVTERGRAILRLYIDTTPPGRGGGVTVEDCSHVSRIVGDLLDVEEAVRGEYHLEVSSPGLFRPLTKPAHFERALGERIQVRTYSKIGDRRVFTGILRKHEEGTLIVEVDGTAHQIALQDVAKANLQPALDF